MILGGRVSVMRMGRNAGTRVAALAATAAVLAAGCKKKDGPGGFPPSEVAVLTLTPQTVPQSFEFPGEVQAYRSVEVRARVDGVILARPFTEGMIVEAGQVLYRLDKVRYQAAYDGAQARFQNAKATYERLAPLLAQHAVAQQDVDNAQAAYTAAQAALESAKKDLDDTDVKAEIQGRVGRTLMEVGARVTGPGDLLATIDRLDPVYVSFDPSSEQLLEWRENPRWRTLIEAGSRLAVQVVLPDGTLLPRAGRLDFVAPALNPATGTQEFRAVFANPDRLLMPGEFVRVRLVGFERDSALAVPERAVMTGLGRQYVYVVGAGDTVQMRVVETGPSAGNRWIINHGLAAGERVIVDGIQKAAPGRPVKPVPYVDSTAVGGPAAAPAAGPGPAASKRGAAR